ncbi:MAG: hypothetical protein HYY91_03660 [Candidatus Omnitrophica bacterium]|nr:hypothetical protein [Candidatus Omnitrophota bacterium]
MPPAPKAAALRLEESHLALPGVVVESVVSRHYPFGSVGAHLLGYLSQPSPETFKTLKEYGVKPKDLVGRAGLEGELDVYLRGEPGGSLIEVEARGRQVGLIGRKDPVPGQTVTLTVDAELEALIAQRFGQQAGAAVVLNPQTGELLAMVSVPSFDPGVFATQDQVAIRRLLADPKAPLMNRAAAGTYLPGSIVKPITAMTALQHRIVSPQTPIMCEGFLLIGNRRFHCWNRDGHGALTMREALMWSCNVYFMELGRRLGLDRLRAGFQQAGFGRKTGWHFEEDAGHLPSARTLHEGEVALLAMGQGEILITPLQGAVMASAIANGGRLLEPWAVRTVGDYAMRAPSPPAAGLGWPAEPLAVVREGMLAVVNDAHGTGIRARSERVPIAGKTGTAQTHVPGKAHGWFIGFCPAHDPAAAMAIVAEYGGSGGELPAMIGRAVCEYLASDTAPPRNL